MTTQLPAILTNPTPAMTPHFLYVRDQILSTIKDPIIHPILRMYPGDTLEFTPDVLFRNHRQEELKSHQDMMRQQLLITYMAYGERIFKKQYTKNQAYERLNLSSFYFTVSLRTFQLWGPYTHAILKPHNLCIRDIYNLSDRQVELMALQLRVLTSPPVFVSPTIHGRTSATCPPTPPSSPQQ